METVDKVTTGEKTWIIRSEEHYGEKLFYINREGETMANIGGIEELDTAKSLISKIEDAISDNV